MSALNGVLKPFFNGLFHMPASTYFDARVIFGSAVFGVGCALGGFCIGLVVTASPLVTTETVIFVVMIMIGMLTVKYFGLWYN